MKKQDPMDSCIIFLLTFDISDIKDFHKNLIHIQEVVMLLIIFLIKYVLQKSKRFKFRCFQYDNRKKWIKTLTKYILT